MPSPRSVHPQDDLTPRQREILDFIRNRLTEGGAPLLTAFSFRRNLASTRWRRR
jgi:SOS-response transcriptional repressor LexA